MKTQGEMESAISACMGKFEQEYMGRGPEEVHTHLIGDLVLVRLRGVLTVAEQHLIKAANEKGRDLLKQVRSHLIEMTRPTFDAMLKGITEIDVISMHHDISTSTGEEILLFTLACAPCCREAKNQKPSEARQPFEARRSIRSEAPVLAAHGSSTP